MSPIMKDSVANLPRQHHSSILALAATAIALFYGAASAPNGFVHDDFNHIVHEAPLRTRSDLVSLFTEPMPGSLPYYRPLIRATLQVQKTLHGDRPLPFHLLNAALAGATLLATWSLLRRPGFRIAPWPAAGAALLFVVHPVASSCVYPADSGRETLLPALLMLLSLRAWMGAGCAAYLGALLALIVALTGKEQAILLPALFLLVDLLGLADDRRSRMHWLRYLPVVVIIAGYLFLRTRLFDQPGPPLALLAWPLGPLWSVLFSVQTLFFPSIPLTYEPPLAVWLSWPRLLAASACLAGLLGAVWRIPAARKPAAFWLLWFLVTQALTANVFLLDAPFEERYVFLAVLAVPALGGTVVTAHWERRWVRYAAIAVLLIGTLAWGTISLGRARYFRDNMAFYTQWAHTNPKSAIALFGLGKAFADAGDLTSALRCYDRAIAVRPAYADALNNRGRILQQLGQTDGAIVAFEQALQADSACVNAHDNLAAILAQRGQLDTALAHCRAALDLVPDSWNTYQNLGGVLTLMGDAPGALLAYERAVNLDPAALKSRISLASALLNSGQTTNAAQHLQVALAQAQRMQHGGTFVTLIQELLAQCRKADPQPGSYEPGAAYPSE